jgi:hypothetical protein
MLSVENELLTACEPAAAKARPTAADVPMKSWMIAFGVDYDLFQPDVEVSIISEIHHIFVEWMTSLEN